MKSNMTDRERWIVHQAAQILRRLRFDGDAEYLSKRCCEVSSEIDEILDAECNLHALDSGDEWIDLSDTD